MKFLKTIILLVISCLIVPQTIWSASYDIDYTVGSANGQVSLSATIPPMLGRDVVLEVLISNDGVNYSPGPMNFSAGEIIYYKINYQNRSYLDFHNLNIYAPWDFESDIVADYIGGTASKALGSINPQIDTNNQIISWDIPVLPANTIGNLTFQLLTHNDHNPAGLYLLYIQAFASDYITTLPLNLVSAQIAYDAQMWLNIIYQPQGRYGSFQTNDQTYLSLDIYQTNSGNSDLVFSQLVRTNPQGRFNNLFINDLAPGKYTVTAKGWANLRKSLEIDLVSGINDIDFTSNSSDPALAGDIDSTSYLSDGSYSQGNNEIEVSDYSTIVGYYDQENDRYNLDQYENSASAPDYSLLVSNYGARGD